MGECERICVSREDVSKRVGESLTILLPVDFADDMMKSTEIYCPKNFWLSTRKDN